MASHHYASPLEDDSLEAAVAFDAVHRQSDFAAAAVAAAHLAAAASSLRAVVACDTVWRMDGVFLSLSDER